MKKIVLTIFIVFSLFGFAGCDTLPNEVGSLEQVAAWQTNLGSVEGILAFHPKKLCFCFRLHFRTFPSNIFIQIQYNKS